MSSLEMWIISKQMESMSISMSNRVVRGNKRNPPTSRYSPYASGPGSGTKEKEKEKQKDEAVRLGVELSIFVAEAMFLLSHDIRSTAWFARWLFDNIVKEDYEGPVVGRVFRGYLLVFGTYIIPKNNVAVRSNSTQWEIITSTYQHFAFAVQALNRIVWILKRSERSLVKSFAFGYCNQELKKLEEKLRPTKHLSEANGFDAFAKEAIKAMVLQVWMSLFQETPIDNTYITHKDIAIFTKIIFTTPPKLHPASDISIISKKMESMSMTHKSLPPSSSYTSGTNLIKEKQKEEAARLGVELSLFVAEAIFLLPHHKSCSMVLFGICVCKYGGKGDYEGPVVGRLLGVIQYVFATYIKPKYPHRLGGRSIQFQQIRKLSRPFTFGLKLLDQIVSILSQTSHGGLVESSALEYYNQVLKKIEEMLRPAKHVSEANGFVREEIKSNILHLWNSLFAS